MIWHRLSLIILTTIASKEGTWAAPNSIAVGIHGNPECTEPFINSDGKQLGVTCDEGGGVPMSTGPDDCVVLSYPSPDGHTQTNARTNFNCCKRFVEYTEMPMSDQCDVDAAAKVMNVVIGVDCVPVETHQGWTYQKLCSYERCDQLSADMVYADDCENENWVLPSTPTGADTNPDSNATEPVAPTPSPPSPTPPTADATDETPSSAFTVVSSVVAALASLAAAVMM